MHSFFNLHIPKYFLVSPIFPNLLLNLISACQLACRDSQHMLVCFICFFSNSFSTFIFSVEVMTQALFYLQGIHSFPFATFIFRCTTNIPGTMPEQTNFARERQAAVQPTINAARKMFAPS